MRTTKIKQHGFSLTEVMVAVFILAFVGLLASQFTLSTVGQTFRMKQRAEAEESLMKAEYLLRRYLSVAVAPPTSDATGILQNSISVSQSAAGATAMHEINLWNFATVASTINETIPMAYFVRENGSAAKTVSDPWTTAIFYQRPTPLTSGVLYIDTGANEADSATYVLTPDFSDQFIDRLVEFDTSQASFSGYEEVPTPGETRGAVNQRISSITVKLAARYFTTPDTSTWRWCPSRDTTTADCNMPKGGYVDLRRELTIALLNNVIGFSQQGALNILNNAVPERVGGQIYYFAPIFSGGM